jgi:hypothetical protein
MKARSPAWALGLGCLLGAAACGPHAPAAPPPVSPGAAAAIVFARCVPHAGSTHRHQGAPPSPFNAECVERQGVVTAGDGDVDIACADGGCTCTLTPHAPGATTTSFTFADASACDGEGGARQLLVTRCMPGR